MLRRPKIGTRTKSPGLGAVFYSELNRALLRLENTPLFGQKVYGQVRRIVLHRFPYLLWYLVEGETVMFWHAHMESSGTG